MRLGGLGFALEPAGALSSAERAALVELDPAWNGEAGRVDFRLSLRPRAPGAPGPVEAVVSADERLVRIDHSAFHAELDPLRGVGSVSRSEAHAYPLTLTLRTAMSSRLPMVGGVPLHAAAVVRKGAGLVFFGVSGAGKSTLARLSCDPVLSDELVALTPRAQGDGYDVCATGVWGTMGRSAVSPHRFRVRALIALDKGPRFGLEAMPPTMSLRRLIEVAMVPAAPWLWSATLEVLASLANTVPVYRMRWSPDRAPFPDLDQALVAERR